ncbi:MAG: single-stranded DNA-binding protein [Anaerolineaceae bacterium]|nr:single-stranded DNA-binding protein [Anaerolineaceae bacterium]
MGTSINIQVTGFVGSDPQVKTVGEQQVASFSVAVSRKNGSGKKQTLWVRVNCWNKLADVAAQYIKKGSLVQVTTEWLRPSAWTDQGGIPQASIDLDANRLVLLDRVESDVTESEGGDIPF